MYSDNEFRTKAEPFHLPTEEPNFDYDFEDDYVETDVERKPKRKRKRKQSLPELVQDEVPDPPYTSEDDSQHFTTNQTFKNLAEAFDWVQGIGRKHKMEMVKVYVVHSSKAKGRLGIVMLCCERHVSYRAVPGTEDENGRRRVMKNLECPFAIKCYQVDPKSWLLEVACGVHNHELGRDTLREKFELEKAAALAAAQSKPKQPKEFECRKAVQLFRNQLAEFNYFDRHRRSKNPDVLSELLFAHPKSLDLLRAFPYVLLMDSALKIGRHDMPFFEVMGITSEWKKFTVACTLMSGENEDNYSWVLNQVQEMYDLVGKRPTTIVAVSNMSNLSLLNAIDKVFPESNRILHRCLLYENAKHEIGKFIRKDTAAALFSRCRSVFEAETEDSYKTQLALFESENSEWNNDRPCCDLVESVKQTWLNSYKEWIVSAWTDRATHFGTHTIEVDGYRRGPYSFFKGLLWYFDGGFSTLFNHLHSELELEIGVIKESLEESRTRILSVASEIECFRMLLACVSFKAFEILVEEYQYATRGVKLDSCNCLLQTTHGLPCAHVIAKYVEEGRPIDPAMIHEFWRTLNFGDDDGDRNRYEEVFDPFYSEQLPNFSDDAGTRVTDSMNETMHPQSVSMQEPPLMTPCQGSNRATSDASGSGGSSSSSSSSAKSTAAAGQSQNSPYAPDIPKFMYRYVCGYNDVLRGGCSAYRAIAASRGLTQEQYQTIKKELRAELYKSWRLEMYRRAVHKANLKHLFDALNEFGGCFPLPDMGHVVASRYKCVFVVLGSETFMPLYVDHGTDLQGIGIISIAYLPTRDHFVSIQLASDSPLPPLASSWALNHDQSVDGLDRRFTSNFDAYRVGPDSVKNYDTDTDCIKRWQPPPVLRMCDVDVCRGRGRRRGRPRKIWNSVIKQDLTLDGPNGGHGHDHAL